MSTLCNRARRLITFAVLTTLLACLTGTLAAQTTGKDNWLPGAPAPAPAPKPAAPATSTPPAPAPTAPPPPAPGAAAATASPTTKPARKPPATQPTPVIWTQTTAPRNDYSKDPAKTLILSPDIPWTYWNSATQAVGVSRKEGYTRFVINEPGGRDVWFRYIQTPPLWERYPIVVMRYRTTGLARKNAGHGLAFSDGSSQNATSVTPLMFEHFVADGEIHEVRADLRLCPKSKAANPGNVIGNLTFALKAEPEQTLVFDLYEIRFEADPDKPNPAIKADLQGTVAVTDPSGQPVVGAMVRPAGEWANLAAEVRTDAKGQARLQWGTGESFGVYTYEGQKPHLNVVATKPGYYTGVTSPSLPLEFGTGVSMSVAQRLSGTLVDDDGKPVAGAGIFLTIAEQRQDGNRGLYASQHIVSDTQGKWETDPLPALQNNISVYSVRLADKRYVSRHYYLGANFGTPIPKEIQITGQTGNKLIIQKGVSVYGRTLDKANNPIPNVRVLIARPQYETYGHPTVPEVRSDKMGVYKLDPIPPGTYTLNVIAPKNAPQWPTLKVASSSDPVLFDINLEPTKPIKARIVDADGKPIPLPSVSCYRWMNREIFFNARANPEGKFTWFAPPQDFVDLRITPDVKVESSYDVTLYPSDDEYTIKLLADGKYTVTPEAVGPAPKPIPAPETLSQPTPGQSIVINLQSPNVLQWNNNDPGTGGVFPNPKGLTLLWQNSNFASQGAYLYPAPELQGAQRPNFKKIIVQYRATTEPAWLPDIPLSPSRDRIGFSIQNDFYQEETSSSASDFVPDGKLREMTLYLPQIPDKTANPHSNSALYLRMAPSSQTQRAYSGKIQSVKVDLTKLWLETAEPLPTQAQPYKQIVRVLDAKNNPLAGCSVTIHPGNMSLTTQITDASGTAFFQGSITQAPPTQAFIQTPSGQTYSTQLQPGITTYTLPAAPPMWPMRTATKPPRKAQITGVVSTPAGPASGAIVWIGRSAREWQQGTVVLANEKGEFTLSGSSFANTPVSRLPGLAGDSTLKIYARLHGMAVAQALPSGDANLTLNLVPIVRPEVVIKDVKLSENARHYPNIEVVGYSSLQVENFRALKFKRPSLIAGDTVQIKGTIEGYQPATLSNVKVTPDMPPITLAFQAGYKVQVTFIDDQGAPLPNIHAMVGSHYSGRNPTDAKGQTLFEGLVVGENTGYITRWGDRFATHLGDGRLKFNVQPGDTSVTQNIQVTLFWRCNLKVIDKTTGNPLPVAYASIEGPGRIPGIFTQEGIDNNKYMWCRITPQDIRSLNVCADKGTLTVWAPGYKPAQLPINKTDPSPRNYEVKLEQAPAEALVKPAMPKP
jgi:hypothetical protein